MTHKALIYTGGYNHPFSESSRALAGVLGARGITCSLETDLDLTLAGLTQVDLLAVNALRWTMTQDEKYAADRADWAFVAQTDQVRTLERWVHAGGRLLAMHTAVLCFDNQPLWIALLGGGWRWGRSHHPPLGPLHIDVVGAEGFNLIDEAYHHLDAGADTEVLATCTMDTGTQTLAWVRSHGRGRVAVNSLGHNARSIVTPGHRALIERMLDRLNLA